MKRYQAYHEDGHLEEAVDTITSALLLAEQTSVPDVYSYRNNLIRFLMERYRLSGARRDLDEAREQVRRGLDDAQSGSPAHLAYLADLTLIADTTQQSEDFNDAAVALTKALDDATIEDPIRDRLGQELATCVRCRAYAVRSQAVCEQSLEIIRSVLARNPSGPRADSIEDELAAVLGLQASL